MWILFLLVGVQSVSLEECQDLLPHSFPHESLCLRPETPFSVLPDVGIFEGHKVWRESLRPLDERIQGGGSCNTPSGIKIVDPKKF